MVQLITALALVAALIYFVVYRGGSSSLPAEGQKPYAAEVQKAEQVEDVLKQTQQLQQQNIDQQTSE